MSETPVSPPPASKFLLDAPVLVLIGACPPKETSFMDKRLLIGRWGRSGWNVQGYLATECALRT